MFMFLPIVIYLFFVAGLIFLIYFFIDHWVTKSLDLKREHNELLREIIRKLESK
jgi:hypothetical protein